MLQTLPFLAIDIEILTLGIRVFLMVVSKKEDVFLFENISINKLLIFYTSSTDITKSGAFYKI